MDNQNFMKVLGESFKNWLSSQNLKWHQQQRQLLLQQQEQAVCMGQIYVQEALGQVLHATSILPSLTSIENSTDLIPNGYELRYRAYDSLLNIVRRYGGDKKYHQRCTFYIPLDMWNIFTEEILAEVHVVLKQIRQAAGWRTDLDYNLNDDLDAILGLSDFELGCGY